MTSLKGKINFLNNYFNFFTTYFQHLLLEPLDIYFFGLSFQDFCDTFLLGGLEKYLEISVFAKKNAKKTNKKFQKGNSNLAS